MASVADATQGELHKGASNGGSTRHEERVQREQSRLCAATPESASRRQVAESG
jgi:hypothetical protein